MQQLLVHNEIKTEYSVSEISQVIKSLVENNFGTVRIRGEISGLKIAASGHAYFNLKDQNALISCTLWKSALSKIKFQIADGMEVLVTGSLGVYVGQSKYQFNVERMELGGIGQMLQILQQRKEKLAKEGLFDQGRKRPIPFLPDVVGIVTSPTGAVIRDMIHRIRERFPVRVIVWPSAVQGEGAANEIAKAIDGLNRMDIAPSVIIVGRGGGSIEDLWAFNEEVVVRAIAASSIPVISAIGHETDFTLADFAADLRAPTPTAAAEFAVPVRGELSSKIRTLWQVVTQHFLNSHARKTKILELTCARLNIISLLRHKQQKFDEVEMRIMTALPNLINVKTAKLNVIAASLRQPDALIARKDMQIRFAHDALIQRINSYVQQKTNALSLLAAGLDAGNIDKIINKGFAVIKVGNTIVSDVGDIGVGDGVQVVMRDGTMDCSVTSISKNT